MSERRTGVLVWPWCQIAALCSDIDQEDRRRQVARPLHIRGRAQRLFCGPTASIHKAGIAHVHSEHSSRSPAGSLTAIVSIAAECTFDALPVELVAAVDALSVDTEQDVDAVTGPLGRLGRVDAGVEPGGQAGGTPACVSIRQEQPGQRLQRCQLFSMAATSAAPGRPLQRGHGAGPSERRSRRPPLPSHRVLDSEGGAALEDITFHRQLGVLAAQPGPAPPAHPRSACHCPHRDGACRRSPSCPACPR